MFEMRKWVTSVPSLAFRSRAMLPDWASSSVVMLAACGVSPTGVMVMVEVAMPLWAATLDPFCELWTSKVAGAVRSRAGVNFRPACPWSTVM